MRLLLSLLVVVVTCTCVRAAPPETTLGKVGKVLLEENFEGGNVPEGWTINTGAMTVVNGALRLSEIASDKHIGAYRKALPLQDMAIRLDFRFENAKAFQLGFDPAKGELKKTGHLYAISIAPNSCSIIENVDKSNPESKTIVHAQASVKLEAKKWYTLVVENKGEEVFATIIGFTPLKAKAADFKVKKPGLVLRAGGPDTAAVLLDNLGVWELN